MKYLIIDSDYLCHRAKSIYIDVLKSTDLTDILIGFFKDIEYFCDCFDTKKVIFCWDSRSNKRYEIYPEYKLNRYFIKKEQTANEIEEEIKYKKIVKKIKKYYLKEAGFRNIFYQKGYESDDIIASICLNNITEKDEAVIISGDYDLCQLIRSNVSLFDPRMRLYLTLQGFYKRYKILPEQWCLFKCLAGCASDNIKGIPKVGIATAVKYIQNKLKPNLQAYKNIISEEGQKIIKFNMRLVKLPLEGVQKFVITDDCVTAEKLKKIKKEIIETVL